MTCVLVVRDRWVDLYVVVRDGWVDLYVSDESTGVLNCMLVVVGLPLCKW